MRPFLQSYGRVLHTPLCPRIVAGSRWWMKHPHRACYSQRNNKPLTNEIQGAPADQQQQQQQKQKKKRRTGSQSSKNSLRRVAVQAGRGSSGTERTKSCTAYCTAEKYDLSLATKLLRTKGYVSDPFSTGLGDQVIHLRLPIPSSVPSKETNYQTESGDVFIFPSGNIVSWSLPPNVVSAVSDVVLPAADKAYSEQDVETEDLEYVEDSRLRRSRVGGDVIIVGTAPRAGSPPNGHGDSLEPAPGSPSTEVEPPLSIPPAEPASGDRTAADELNITLAKVAFSSGLARSTKLAVLESLLDEYLTTTSDIPKLLSRGSKLPFTRSFILCKTGELLEFRAQLNLYSELTDSLPDIFWDSRHELGLEGYYDSIGRALDVDVRIRQLNAKLDYASGIVEVLRERLSERHSLALEWMIIFLIAIEVGFEVRRLWGEAGTSQREAREYKEWREKREREQDEEFQRWRKEYGAEWGGRGE